MKQGEEYFPMLHSLLRRSSQALTEFGRNCIPFGPFPCLAGHGSSRDAAEPPSSATT